MAVKHNILIIRQLRKFHMLQGSIKTVLERSMKEFSRKISETESLKTTDNETAFQQKQVA